MVPPARDLAPSPDLRTIFCHNRCCPGSLHCSPLHAGVWAGKGPKISVELQYHGKRWEPSPRHTKFVRKRVDHCLGQRTLRSRRRLLVEAFENAKCAREWPSSPLKIAVEKDVAIHHVSALPRPEPLHVEVGNVATQSNIGCGKRSCGGQTRERDPLPAGPCSKRSNFNTVSLQSPRLDGAQTQGLIWPESKANKSSLPLS